MTSIPVFLSSDNNYAPFIATTIASICDNTTSYVDIYVLDGGITFENKEKINKLKEKFKNFSIEFIRIDLEKEFKGFHTSGHISLSSYSRFLIPRLKPSLGKVIYSDVDVIFLGDIKSLYDENLGCYALAAVWEEKYEDGFNFERKRRLNLSSYHKYFCAGHLIMDCDKWRENFILEELMKIACEKPNILKGHDQDTLNIYFDDNYKILPAKYSFFYGVNTDEVEDEVIIRHYTKIKPWDINPNIDNSFNTDHDLFWKYAKMTSFYDELILKTKYNDPMSLRKRSQIINIIEKQYRG